MGPRIAIGLSACMTVLMLMGNVAVSAIEVGEELIIECLTCAERANNSVREMSVYSRGLEFHTEEALKQRNLLIREIRAMEEEHAKFLESLSPAEKETFSKRIGIMEQERRRIWRHLREMDRQFRATEPDAWRIGQEADGIGACIFMWTRQYGLLGKL